MARTTYTSSRATEVLELAKEAMIRAQMGNRAGSWLAYQELLQVPATKQV